MEHNNNLWDSTTDIKPPLGFTISTMEYNNINDLRCGLSFFKKCILDEHNFKATQLQHTKNQVLGAWIEV